MSDREEGEMSERERSISPSHSLAYSIERSPGLLSDKGSVSLGGISPGKASKSPSPVSKSRSRSRSYNKRYSRSRSRTPVRRSRSGAREGRDGREGREGARDGGGRDRDRDRDRDRHERGRRYHSRSRSRSPYGRGFNKNRYRSRSRSPYGGRNYSPTSGYSDRRRGYYRSHSRSPMSGRRRHKGNREEPLTSRCIGVFGLSLYTQERDLREFFGHYGPIEDIQVVYDHQTGRSRGFAFLYFRNLDDAVEAKERAPGSEIDGRKIRIDYSITERAHTPTPGIYLGKPTSRGYRSSRRSPSPYAASYHRRGGGGYSRSHSRSRSYSPRRYSYY